MTEILESTKDIQISMELHLSEHRNIPEMRKLMESTQISMVLHYMEYHNLLTMAPMGKEMVEYMDK